MIELRQLRVPVALLTLALSSGCSALDNCPSSQDDITIAAKPENTDLDLLSYDSDPTGVTFTPFPAKTMLRFEHDLGVTPSLILPYLSFAGNGTNGAGGGSVSLAAGNEALIECADSHVIVIKNDTCERSFFIHVVTFGVAKNADPDACSKKP